MRTNAYAMQDAEEGPQRLPEHRPEQHAEESDPLGFLGGFVAGAMCSAVGSTTWLWSLGVLLLNVVPQLERFTQPARPLLNLDRLIGGPADEYALFVFIGGLFFSFLPVALALSLKEEAQTFNLRNGLFLGWMLGLFSIPIMVFLSFTESLGRLPSL
ncbi:MAG: hypothetical protein OXM03_00385 [Chloroflexota bacterium]|nr:hypothetical protein [Chloroflexota bacterium]MDE2839066.1 hypothetical protein [Chloroflexota bacterium]MDE2931212.1 hypothetical protein [Chloroflexota bacterium]